MNKRDILDYMAYVVSSAKGCINEPKMYGPFRLVDSIEKFMALLKKYNLFDDEEVNRVAEKIANEKLSVMTDEEKFISMLDEVTFELIEILKNCDEQ
ncbi:MAG: DUF6092 family protein [Tepidanaerobacteraceae bacterium]